MDDISSSNVPEVLVSQNLSSKPVPLVATAFIISGDDGSQYSTDAIPCVPDPASAANYSAVQGRFSGDLGCKKSPYHELGIWCDKALKYLGWR